MNEIMMPIPAQKSVAYPIRIETDLLKNPDKWMPSHWQSRCIVIITDEQVNQLYGKLVCDVLKDYQPLLLSFSPGEKSKNYHTKYTLIESMIENRCNRDTVILSLGGGVVGDIAGFIASIYMRGVSYIQIPTTLLAMIDSSVGGKTGINMQQGKNLIGSFWQPSGVVIDLNCLKTLSQEQMINGLIEAIKMFLTNDVHYFHYTHDHIDAIVAKDAFVLSRIIEQAIKIKVSIVSHDEKENHQRMILNFGHTIGHALEKLTDYSMLHGYAVALGILVEAKISQLLGFMKRDDFLCITALLQKLNITPQQLKLFDINSIIQATYVDKKAKSNQVRYVLLKTIGQVYQDKQIFSFPVTDDIVREALLTINAPNEV